MYVIIIYIRYIQGRGGLVSLCYLHGSYLQVGDLQYIQACYICQR